MYQGKKILALIPARGGSKSIVRKNIRPLMGKPLIGWTIEEAKKSKYIDRLILSSDDDQIIDCAKSFGCDVPFKRPAELAKDDVPGAMAAVHALEVLPGYDILVFLQPTSPLRKAEDIDGAIEFSASNTWSRVASVYPPENNPFWMYWLDDTKAMTPIIPNERINLNRQLLPQAWVLNGCVFVATAQHLKESPTFLIAGQTKAYQMTHERSVDLNTEADFFALESVLMRRQSLVS